MTMETAKKLCYIVNSVLLVVVLGMLGLFAVCKATFLVWFSIPTIAVYLIGYGMIHKNHLASYIWMIYFWIAIYMSVATICLGYQFGFHLYCMSLIPVIFCSEYMGYKMGLKSIRAVYVSVGLVVTYIACTAVAVYNGPVYEVEGILPNILLAINASIVFSFLIIYTRILLQMVVKSEEELRKMAHVDRLTGLYNRHYMIDRLTNSTREAKESDWIAMVDIDDFKKINDTYGHNFGDFVLVHLGELLREVCGEAYVSRWGGEEFLIMAEADHVSVETMETLRRKVEEKPFSMQGTEIHVTITVGVATYRNGESIDAWIGRADDKLYYGKNNGKNRVVM